MYLPSSWLCVCVRAGVYATLTAPLCLAGQHWSHYGEPCVSDLPRHRLEGGEQRVAVCLPPGSSDVARKLDIHQSWTPPPAFGPPSHLTSALMTPKKCKHWNFCQLNCSSSTYIRRRKHQAVTAVFLTMCLLNHKHRCGSGVCPQKARGLCLLLPQ